MMGHYQIVVPDALINTVLKVVHDSPLGGHCGINNTLDRAKEHLHNRPIVIKYAWLPFAIQVNCHFLNSQLSVTKHCPDLEVPSFFPRKSRQ
jgi:hypothetical protein